MSALNRLDVDGVRIPRDVLQAVGVAQLNSSADLGGTTTVLEQARTLHVFLDAQIKLQLLTATMTALITPI